MSQKEMSLMILLIGASGALQTQAESNNYGQKSVILSIMTHLMFTTGRRMRFANGEVRGAWWSRTKTYGISKHRYSSTFNSTRKLYVSLGIIVRPLGPLLQI